jgi:hypothetical protein
MGKVWRPHSAEYVLRHLDYLIKTFRIEHILFEDDNINAGPARFEEMLDGIKSRGYKIFWDTPNGIRADKLNASLIRKAKESGCRFLKIGIESGDQYVVNRIVKKHLDLKKVVEVAKLCQEIGLGLQAFFIIGFPGETKREIKRTVDFSLNLFRKYNVLSAIGPAKPLIGTELREECKRLGYLTLPLETPEMKERLISRQEMIKTRDFDLDYLFKVIRNYERRRRLITLEKVITHLLKRPKLLLSMVKILTEGLLQHPEGVKAHLKQAFNGLRLEMGLR